MTDTAPPPVPRPGPLPALYGALNFRDLGGLPTVDGRRTVAGRLFRSDSLHELTAADVDTLTGRLGVRAVLDLRTAAEVAEQGRGLLGATSLSYLNVPLCDARPDGGAPHDAALRFYLTRLDSDPNLAAAVELLVGAVRRPTVLHCAAGKDRTGMVTALVLRLIGVEDRAIVADYLATAANMPRIVARLRARARYRESMAALPALYRAEEHTIAGFLAGLDARYGGVTGWARRWDLPDDLADRARRALLPG